MGRISKKLLAKRKNILKIRSLQYSVKEPEKPATPPPAFVLDDTKQSTSTEDVTFTDPESSFSEETILESPERMASTPLHSKRGMPDFKIEESLLEGTMSDPFSDSPVEFSPIKKGDDSFSTSLATLCVNPVKKVEQISDSKVEESMLEGTMSYSKVEFSPIPKSEESFSTSKSHVTSLVNPVEKVKRALDFASVYNCLEAPENQTVESFNDSDDEIFQEITQRPPSETRVTYQEALFDFPNYDGDDDKSDMLIMNYKQALGELLNPENLDDPDDELEKPIPPKQTVPYHRSKLFNIKFTEMVPKQTLQRSESLLIDINVLNKIQKISGALCPRCEGTNLYYEVKKTKIKTFVPTIIYKCRSCKKILASNVASERISLPQNDSRKKTYDIGFGTTVGFLESGIGYAAAVKSLANMNLPAPSKSLFYSNLKSALSIILNMTAEMKKEAARIVIDFYMQRGCQLQEGKMNIEVSFDGTWMTRGSASLVGVGFIVEVETGIILDYEILEKYCNVCTKQSKKLQLMTQEQRDAWEENHKPQCHANYSSELSSSSMEAKIAEILFARSENNGLRYTTILSDEDSSTYKRLLQLNPYGNSYKIMKTNCLNHINKKIYYRLEELRVKNHLGGQGEGKLTQKSAQIFAKFYRFFVKKYHGNHNKIRKNVLASVFHHAATDVNPLHQLCPKGLRSWCKFQRDLAGGITPGKDWHKNPQNRKYSLSPEASRDVLGVMLKMLSEDVLSRISSKTQNMNESIHSKLWGIIPKSKYRGRNQIDYAVAKITLIHNCGDKAANILEPMNLEPSKILQDVMDAQERSRGNIKEKSFLSKKKNEKKKLKKSKDYKPGGFEH